MPQEVPISHLLYSYSALAIGRLVCELLFSSKDLDKLLDSLKANFGNAHTSPEGVELWKAQKLAGADKLREFMRDKDRPSNLWKQTQTVFEAPMESSGMPSHLCAIPFRMSLRAHTHTIFEPVRICISIMHISCILLVKLHHLS